MMMTDQKFALMHPHWLDSRLGMAARVHFPYIRMKIANSEFYGPKNGIGDSVMNFQHLTFP